VPRRYGQWASAVLFVVVAVLLAGWLWQQKSDRVEMLAVAHPVPAGAVITANDLKVVEVAGVADGVPASESADVVGNTAAVGLVEDQILSHDVVTPDPVPGAGQRVVGLQLDATRTPSGLAPGDVVAVLAVEPSGDPGTPAQLDKPTVLADTARIVSAEQVEGAGTRLSVLVTSDVADQVASYAAAGRVALVQGPVGGDH
jgi:hypothetical protein